jgi:hypothetical protein
MKKIFLLIALALLTINTVSALDPIKVAIVNTGTTPVAVEVRLSDYTGGTASLVYTQASTNYTPNGSGIIIANIAGAGWTAIASNTVTNYHILDVYVGGTLAAQYRLDNLLLSQGQGGVLDIEGNLTPPESGAGSVGSDDNRWSEVYIEESTMHIGPADGEFNNTELALSYNTGTNTAHIQVDATDAILVTSTGVTIPGTLTATGATTLSNLNGVSTRNIAVNASGQVVVAESSVLTDATIDGNGTTGSLLSLADNAVTSAKIDNGAVTPVKLSSAGAGTGDVITYDGTNVVWSAPGGGGTVSRNSTLAGDGSGGSPLGINLANANTWTGNQTFGNVTTTGTLDQQGAVSNSTGDVVINDDANVTGSLDVDTDLNVDGNSTHVGTLDQQGAVSNSTGDVVINDDANVTGSLDVDTDLNVDGNSTHVGTLDQQGAVSNSTGDVVINDDANVTGSLDVDTDLNIDGNTTLVGTLDQQGAISNSTGNVNISDNLVVTGYSDLQGSIGSTAGNLQIGDYVYINGDGTTNLTLTDGSIQRNSGSNETITLQNTGAGNLTLAVTGDVTASGDVTLSNLAGGGTQNIQVDNTGKIVVGGGGGGGTVSTNSTINGDGSGGSPLGINLANFNTWTSNQTFAGGFLITSNTRIALTNSDNNARDIRFQEPSSSGSQYIGWRAPSVTSNSNYVFPASIGTPGQVLALNTVSSGSDTATTHWITPSSSGNLAYTEVTADTTLNTDNRVVYITGAYTVTLPASPATGQLIQIYSESTTATLNPQSKVFRDGGSDYGTSAFSDFTAGTNLSLYYNGAKWLPVGRR